MRNVKMETPCLLMYVCKIIQTIASLSFVYITGSLRCIASWMHSRVILGLLMLINTFSRRQVQLTQNHYQVFLPNDVGNGRACRWQKAPLAVPEAVPNYTC